MSHDDHMIDATRYLIESLEVSMFSPAHTKQAHDLKEFLSKLGVKSAKNTGMSFGGPLRIESLDATLKQVTFNMNNLKLWPKLKKK